MPLDSQSHRLTFFSTALSCPSVHSPQLWPLSCSKHSRKAGVQSVLIKPAGSAAPGDLLEMQTLRPDPRPNESDDCGWNLTVCIFTSPPRNSHACWSLENHCWQRKPSKNEVSHGREQKDGFPGVRGQLFFMKTYTPNTGVNLPTLLEKLQLISSTHQPQLNVLTS